MDISVNDGDEEWLKKIFTLMNDGESNSLEEMLPSPDRMLLDLGCTDIPDFVPPEPPDKRAKLRAKLRQSINALRYAPDNTPIGRRKRYTDYDFDGKKWHYIGQLDEKGNACGEGKASCFYKSSWIKYKGTFFENA